MYSGAHIVDDIVFYGLTLAPVPIATLAWKFGRPAERYGATLHCAVAVTAVAYTSIAGASLSPVAQVAVDTATALVFLLLALRYNSLWLGFALMVKGAQLALHATHLSGEPDRHVGGFNMYFASLNLISILLLAAFVAATATNIKRQQSAACRQ